MIAKKDRKTIIEQESIKAEEENNHPHETGEETKNNSDNPSVLEKARRRLYLFQEKIKQSDPISKKNLTEGNPVNKSKKE